MPSHPADYSPLAAAVGGAAFWLFIAVVVVASVIGQAFRHRETQKTIRQAIERGQTLDPQTLERLLAADRPPPPNRTGLAIGGLVMVCLGGGVALMGWFGSHNNPEMFYQARGGGALIAMIGVPLLIASAFMRGRGGAGRG